MGIVFLIVFLSLLIMLFFTQRKNVKFTTRVFLGLLLGILFGVIIQQLLNHNIIIKEQLDSFTEWLNLVGSGYTNLLRLIVQPLIFISIISTVVNLDNSKNITKIASFIIFILILSAMVSAGIGIFSAKIFNLNANDFEMGELEIHQEQSLLDREEYANQPLPAKILEIIPFNVFQDLSASRGTSTIGLVIFACLFGIAARYIEKEKKEQFDIFKKFTNSLNSIILAMVDFILVLTPYGVLAIMTKTIANTNYFAIVQLGKFVLASYFGLILIYILHLSIVSLVALNPVKFIKKSWPVLSFAFVSRSSAAAIPLNAGIQEKSLGVDKGIASLSASLGATIGQNGCAGLYPAMLVIMITNSIGDPINYLFIIQLLFVIGITSFGVAGIGGGATYASIIVLTTMNLPIGLAALLISIEPVIDMGRTLINVNGSMTAGVVSAYKFNLLDKKIYDN